MNRKKLLVVVPTNPEFEHFKRRALENTNPSQRIVHVPTSGSSSNTIRLSIEDPRSEKWIEVFIVCLGGQGLSTEKRFRRYLDDIDPHLVVIAGIAGGILDHDLCIGDIAISDFVYSPNYEKAHPQASKANLQPFSDEFADHIANTTLFSELSEALTKFVQSSIETPTDDELRRAAENQGLSDAEQDEAVLKSRNHFDRVFDPSGGIMVSKTETYSQPTNQQGLDNAFKRYSAANPELGIAEMEAAVIWRELKRSGRASGPLIVKCISDTLGLARSESLKEFCRQLAAEALFGIIESTEFARALNWRDERTGVNSLALNSFTRAFDSTRHGGLICEETLIRLTAHPETFSDQDVAQIAGRVSDDIDLAITMADVWVHFTEVCPRCSRGAPNYLKLGSVIGAAFDAISKNNNEIVRVGTIAGTAPLFGIDTTAVETLDWDSLIDTIRGDPHCESKKTALMGRVYQLMSRNLDCTVRFIIKLKRTGEFHDQAIAIWFFTAVAAAVSRGENIEIIRSKYSTWWDTHLGLYNERNPYSYIITLLLPFLKEREGSWDDPDVIDHLNRLEGATAGGLEEGDLGLAERMISLTLLSKADPKRDQWAPEDLLDFESFSAVNLH